MTAVAEMRAAAATLRDLASKATPGPWCFYGDDLWTGTAAVLQAYDAATEEEPWPFGEDRGHLFHGDAVRPADAAYIATMNPSVAGPLADWLDHTADIIDAYRGSVAHVGCAFQALVTARAVNGGEP